MYKSECFYNISIHALREEGDTKISDKTVQIPISIHALREEGDRQRCKKHRKSPSDFYPRPPRGGRLWSSASVCGAPVFLSTPSARRATYLDFCCFCFFSISIHALREEGDLLLFRTKQNPVISIHALREEGDVKQLKPGKTQRNFYPRPPRGGRLQRLPMRA